MSMAAGLLTHKKAWDGAKWGYRGAWRVSVMWARGASAPHHPARPWPPLASRPLAGRSETSPRLARSYNAAWLLAAPSALGTGPALVSSVVSGTAARARAATSASRTTGDPFRRVASTQRNA